MENRITRRQIVVRGALSLIAIGGLAVAAGAWQRHRSSLPGPNDVPSFDDFLVLSRALLKRDQLDLPVARKIYDTILAEPWGPQHIATLLHTVQSKPANGDLTPDEKWFASHVLTTWYTGIYFYEHRDEQRMSFAVALMYDAVRTVMPTPFSASSGYAAWATPPIAE
jgi:hypothetical protein